VLAERRIADFLVTSAKDYVIDVCFCSPVFATMFVTSAKTISSVCLSLCLCAGLLQKQSVDVTETWCYIGTTSRKN